MTRFRSLVFASVYVLSACSHPAPKVTLDLLDTSSSISPRSEHAAQSAILDQISRLARVDRLILIPITGDAQNDSGGKILHLVAPTERQAYDADLKQFRDDAKKQYLSWAASFDPGQTQTDILGTLDLARQELAGLPENSRTCLIFLSDFLEEDAAYQFVYAPQLTGIASARLLADGIRAERNFSLPGVPIYLGRLESADFARLAPQRKEAVKAFWTEYLKDRGKEPIFRFDGTGLLAANAGDQR